MLDEGALRKHLATLGWEANAHGAATFRCPHATPEGEVVVYLRLQEHWLVGSVVPFLSTKGDNSFELARWLLRMNRDMHQAKFAYDEDGDVILTVELPTESLDFSEIQAALEGLVAEAIKHRKTLRAAAATA